MAERQEVNEEAVRQLMRCRDLLLTELAEAEDCPLPEGLSKRLWEAHKTISEVVERLKELTGIQEPPGVAGWTVDPDANR